MQYMQYCIISISMSLFENIFILTNRNLEFSDKYKFVIPKKLKLFNFNLPYQRMSLLFQLLIYLVLFLCEFSFARRRVGTRNWEFEARPGMGNLVEQAEENGKDEAESGAAEEAENNTNIETKSEGLAF